MPTITFEAYAASVRELQREARTLAEGLTAEQFGWQPGGGSRWSVAECLNHLAVANQLYLDAMEPAVRSAAKHEISEEIRTAGWPSSKFVRDLEPPPAYKMKAPGKIVPRPNPNGEAALASFLAGTERILRLLDASRNVRPNKLRFRNPFIPLLRFTIGTGLLIMAAHSRRHLWQAEQLKREAGFPA